jgi:hypothetical protein
MPEPQPRTTMTHRNRTSLLALLAAAATAACASNGGEPPPPAATHAAHFAFDGLAGGLPAGFTVAATRPADPTASWSVVADASAPSGGHALALSSSTHGSSGTYNLCWSADATFGDGELSVAFRADSGRVDQGGGPIWRARDADNYYICRANPLEDNFRVYTVENGVRRQLASADCTVPAGEWHTITVRHVGESITCTLNGTVTLTVEDDTFPASGGVGLWTKADAVTRFDELVLAPAN